MQGHSETYVGMSGLVSHPRTELCTSVVDKVISRLPFIKKKKKKKNNNNNNINNNNKYNNKLTN